MTSHDNEHPKNKRLWAMPKRCYLSGSTRVYSTKCHIGSIFCVEIQRILSSNASGRNFYRGCLRRLVTCIIKALKLISVLKRDLHLKEKSPIYSSWSNCNKEKELYNILNWKFTKDFLPLESISKKSFCYYWHSREVLVIWWKWKYANPSHLSTSLQWQSQYQ